MTSSTVPHHSINEWYDQFLGLRAIPPRRPIHDNSPSEGYAVLLDDIQLNQSKPGQLYCVQVYFFDSKAKHFFGRPYCTDFARAANDGRIHFGQDLFFHCPVKGEDLRMVFEVIEADESSAPGQQMDERTMKTTVGFGVQTVNRLNTPLQEYRDSLESIQRDRLLVIGGSPKSLLCSWNFSQEDIAVIGAMHCTLLSHRELLKAIDYFPDFCIIGENDDIPGLFARSDAPQLLEPRVSPPLTTFIDNIGVTFGEHAERIEKGLLEYVNNDRLYRENHAPDSISGQPTEVIERRFRIGVHNGYTFLSEPLIVHLSSSSEVEGGAHSLRRKGRSPSRNRIRADDGTFFVRSKVSIPKVSADSRLSVVFALDYLLGIKAKDSTIHSSQSVMLSWGAWKPFGNDGDPDHDVSVPLIGGPRPNPEESLCFKNVIRLFRENGGLPGTTPEIRLNFSFHVEDPKYSHSSISRSVLDQTAPTPQPKPDVALHRVEFLEDSERKKEKNDSGRQRADDGDFEELSGRLPRVPSTRSILSSRNREEHERFHDVIDRVIDYPSERERENEVQVYQMSTARVAAMPRSVFAAISHAKFPPILDRNGDPPELIDPSVNQQINEAVEAFDRLDTNEVVVQFMALKWLNKFDLLAGRRVFFTFQMYRFPQVTTEKLLVEEYNQADPGILKRLDANDAVVNEQGAGLMVKLTIDRNSLRSGDSNEFVTYLNKNSLCIDVWDGDSLQLVGSAQLPLKYLLRNGLESVQSYVQCPIVQTSLPEPPKMSGLLYVRMANIGHPSCNQIDLVHSQNTAVVSKRLQKLGDEGAESYRIRARPLNPAHESALQRFMHAQRIDIAQRKAEIFNEESFEKIQHWEKMKREAPFSNNEQITRKFIFDEELEAYKKIRHESKAARLLQAVFKGITLQHRIYPSLGQTEFFEFLLHNTYPDPVNAVIDIEEVGLSVVRDVNQWSFYKKANNLDTPLDTNLFRTNKHGQAEVFLKPNEAVYIPFVYDDFKGSNHTDGQVTQTKTVFKRWDTGDPLAILDLHIVHRPFALNQSYRFIGEEMSNLKKQIRITGFSGNQRAHLVKSSDPKVSVEVKSNGVDQDLIFTSYCGPSGSSKTFLVLFYADAYAYQSLGVWKITTHSMTRLDVKGAQAQTSKLNLEIRKSVPDNQLVQLYSSHPAIKPSGVQPTLLTADENKISVNFTPEYTGPRLHLLTAVDVSNKDLLGAWIVHTEVQPPSISKQYEIRVPIGSNQIVTKKLPIQNSYGLQRTFRVLSSRPELVQLEQEVVDMAANSSQSVTLIFHPVVKKPIGIEVLIFVQNSETGQSEDTFSLRISYISD